MTTFVHLCFVLLPRRHALQMCCACLYLPWLHTSFPVLVVMIVNKATPACHVWANDPEAIKKTTGFRFQGAQPR